MLENCQESSLVKFEQTNPAHDPHTPPYPPPEPSSVAKSFRNGQRYDNVYKKKRFFIVSGPFLLQNPTSSRQTCHFEMIFEQIGKNMVHIWAQASLKKKKKRPCSPLVFTNYLSSQQHILVIFVIPPRLLFSMTSFPK